MSKLPYYEMFSIKNRHQASKDAYGGMHGVDDIISTAPKPPTASDLALQTERAEMQRRIDFTHRRYTQSQAKLLQAIKGVLHEFAPYQLLLQSESYRNLEELVAHITADAKQSDQDAAEMMQRMNEAYMDALRYRLGGIKSP
jgi:hypothetical protein